MPTRLHTTKAASSILAGVEEAAKVVGVTYGPHGRTVMLDRAGGLLATKDGVSVAWEVEPADPFRRIGVRILQDACHKINKDAGDGTTTTAILVHAILAEAHKWCAVGAKNPAKIASELQDLAAFLEQYDYLEHLVMPVESQDLLMEVALQASHGDHEAAQAIVDAFDLVGAEGMVSIEEGKGRGIEIVQKNGLEINLRGLESFEFLEAGETSLHLDTAMVALVDGELHTLTDVQALLEQATQFPYPFVLVSRGCFGEALQVLVMNNRKLKRADGQDFVCVAVRVPGHPDQQRQHLLDIAAVTGATVIDPAVFPLDNVDPDRFGFAQSSTLKRDSSVFVAYEDKYDLIEQRVLELKRQRDGSSHSFDVEQLNERIAKLSNGFCLLRVGGATEAELRERRGRIEDALSATRCAVEGGLVPGGGVVYLALAQELREIQVYEFVVENILVPALQAPLKWITKNAGYEFPVILQQIQEIDPDFGWEGWDARTNTVRDFSQSPVVAEPYEVFRQILRVAISTAALLLNTSVAITKAP